MIKKVLNNIDKDFIFSIILILILFLFPYFGCFGNVVGHSMEQTLHEGDYLFVWNFNTVNKGDIVVIDKDGYDDFLVKRIIGVSGDRIKFKDNNLYVNDKLLVEDYVNSAEKPVYLDYEEVVADNSYFVLGDNRNHSGDSRSFGDVKEHEIKGVVKANLSKVGITRNRLLILVVLLLVIENIGYIRKQIRCAKNKEREE